MPPPQAGRDRAAFGGVASGSNFWAQIYIHGGVVADVPNQPLSPLPGINCTTYKSPYSTRGESPSDAS